MALYPLPETPPQPLSKKRPGVAACSACTAWFLDPDNKMTALGYGRCPHLPVGQYVAEKSACRLPSKFKEKP